MDEIKKIVFFLDKCKMLKLMLKHMNETVFVQQQYTKNIINQFYG